MTANKRLRAALQDITAQARATVIARAIPTQYQGNLVWMDVEAKLEDGTPVRHWVKPQGAGEPAHWSRGISAQQAALTGQKVQIWNRGSDALGSQGRKWNERRTV